MKSDNKYSTQIEIKKKWSSLVRIRGIFPTVCLNKASCESCAVKVYLPSRLDFLIGRSIKKKRKTESWQEIGEEEELGKHETSHFPPSLESVCITRASILHGDPGHPGQKRAGGEMCKQALRALFTYVGVCEACKSHQKHHERSREETKKKKKWRTWFFFSRSKQG